MTVLPDIVGLIEALPEPVLVFTKEDLNLSWMNPAAESWLRCSLASKQRVTLANVVDGLGKLEPVVRKTLESGATIRGHDLLVNKMGLGRTEASYLIFPYEGRVAIMLSANRHDTGQETDGQKGQAVGMFGRMLAHELKNPLAGIYGAVQLLEAGISDETDLEITQLIKSEVKRIGRLADKMEDFSISEEADFENFNIHTVLRKALLLFQNADNNQIEFIENYDPSLPHVFGNADKLMQVVINFLANATDAIKAKKGSGTIEVQTLFRAGVRKQAPWGGVHALPIEVKIIDNGGGIAPEIKDRIFQPFVTGKANGHGLGLALVSKIIDEHGGIVSCHSGESKTVFSLLLPAKKDEKTRVSS